ncbi:MAG: asparagine synthase C-terminal domain-containing protein [Candidatus Altiarchaeota archaeon]
MEDYVRNLKELFVDAVRRECADGGVGVILSGGLDSTLVAVTASRLAEVTSYSVGIADSDDLKYARLLLESSKFEGRIIEFTVEDVEVALKPIVRLVGVPDPLKVSVAVPFYFASRRAGEDGLRVMLCGQGPDELFGGYNRYLEILSEDGYGSLQEALDYDVSSLFDGQLRYDAAVCRGNGIELRFPFTDEAFVNYAKGIPPELKIREVKDGGEYDCVDVAGGRKFIRKYVLRKMAEKSEVPDYIINRRKRAAQYGSGSHKILQRLAKEKGFRERASKDGRRDYVRMYLESLL